jgi:hypothetical protein
MLQTTRVREENTIKTIRSANKVSAQVIDGFVKGPSKKPTAAHHLHKRTEKAHTLMRGALKNPASNLGVKIQRLHPGQNPMREVRAQTTHKHSQVRRFGSPAHKQAMRYDAAKHFWQKPGFLGRRAGLKIAICGVILLFLIGFAAWRTVPALSVKVAGTQAHINASVPSYTPTGYVQAAPASDKNQTVVIRYKSSADSTANYEITQSKSSMNSTSVTQSVVPRGTQVQTSQAGGNTVYIYGDQNNAVWVNNGVMYKITDHANLSSDEILKIVQGLNN